MRKFFIAALFVGVLASCKKNETPYTAPVIAGSKTIGMGADMQNQIFVNLSTGDTVSRPVANWDISFECSGGTAIRINSAKKSAVYNSQLTDFSAVTTAPAAKAFAYDDPSGDVTQTAIDTWDNNGNGQSKNYVYIINLGNNPPSSTTGLGYKKFQITGFANGKYTFHYANLDGTAEQTATISVNANTEFAYYSMQNNTMVDIEPNKNNWDILFTGVTIPGGGPAGSYTISIAALSNRYNGALVAVDNPGAGLTASDEPDSAINKLADSVSHYSKITVADFARLGSFEDAMTIGRNWYSIIKPHTAGIYKVYSWKTYILKNKAGKYFKLRFTAYKNLETGEKGYPSFEYQQL